MLERTRGASMLAEQTAPPPPSRGLEERMLGPSLASARSAHAQGGDSLVLFLFRVPGAQEEAEQGACRGERGSLLAVTHRHHDLIPATRG